MMNYFTQKYIIIAIITAAIGGWFWFSSNKEMIKEKAIEAVIEKTVDSAVNKAADDIKEKAVEKITDLFNNK